MDYADRPIVERELRLTLDILRHELRAISEDTPGDRDAWDAKMAEFQDAEQRLRMYLDRQDRRAQAGLLLPG
jgi:hypothetical protein